MSLGMNGRIAVLSPGCRGESRLSELQSWLGVYLFTYAYALIGIYRDLYEKPMKLIWLTWASPQTGAHHKHRYEIPCGLQVCFFERLN